MQKNPRNPAFSGIECESIGHVPGSYYFIRINLTSDEVKKGGGGMSMEMIKIHLLRSARKKVHICFNVSIGGFPYWGHF